MILRFILITALACGQMAAAAPTDSLRPVARSETDKQTETPQPEDSGASSIAQAGPDAEESPRLSLRPFLRSRKVQREARQRKKMLKRGAVCDDLDIQGELVGAVPGKLNGCGLQKAVKIRSVDGITLTQQSVMDCNTAHALKRWVKDSVRPAFSRKGGGLTSLKVAAHYSCRTRNNRKGAKISEHGKGRAIDISGFILADGTMVTVLKGWNDKRYRKAMRQVHQGACGPFGTVLGPDADRYHKDHFHFDTARYRSGSYCR